MKIEKLNINEELKKALNKKETTSDLKSVTGYSLQIVEDKINEIIRVIND